MAVNFPTSLDDFTNPIGSDDVSVVLHAEQHTDHNDAIEALEAKLGIDSSAVTTSIDYLLKSTSSVSPGHKHNATDIADGTVSNTEFQYLGGVTSDIQTQLNSKGTGNVTKVGTPANNQIGVWTGDGTIEGDTNLTFSGSELVINNSTKNFEIGLNSSYNAVFGHAFSSGDNITQYQFQYFNNTGYENQGIKIDDTGHNYQTVISQTASGALYWVDGAGGVGSLTIGKINNPYDSSYFGTAFGQWFFNSGSVGFSTTNPTSKFQIGDTSTAFVGTDSLLKIAGDFDSIGGVTLLEVSGNNPFSLKSKYGVDLLTYNPGTGSFVMGSGLYFSVPEIRNSGIIYTGTIQGYNYDIHKLYFDDSGIGFRFTATDNPAIGIQYTGTAEQLRLRYDSSNYLSTTVSSTGSTTFALTGTSPVFNFSQAVGIPNGTKTAPSLFFTSETNLGIYRAGANCLAIGNGGNHSFDFLNTNYKGFRLGNNFAVSFGSGDLDSVDTDTGIARDSAGVLKVTKANGTTDLGNLQVEDEAYGAGWNGSLEVPTKNALYDKIETLSAGSGITRTVVTTSGSLTLGSTASTDYVYYVSGAHTLSMPSPNTNRYTIKNLHSAAITVDTAGAENIEGAASLSLQPNDSIDVISDGTNWYVH